MNIMQYGLHNPSYSTFRIVKNEQDEVVLLMQNTFVSLQDFSFYFETKSGDCYSGNLGDCNVNISLFPQKKENVSSGQLSIFDEAGRKLADTDDTIIWGKMSLVAGPVRLQQCDNANNLFALKFFCMPKKQETASTLLEISTAEDFLLSAYHENRFIEHMRSQTPAASSQNETGEMTYVQLEP